MRLNTRMNGQQPMPADFDTHWERLLAKLKPGGVLRGTGGHLQLANREARLLHARFGVVAGDDLPEGVNYEIDWSVGAKPIVRLSRALFAHVADCAEAA